MNVTRFAWDMAKAVENQRKHAVSFEEATTVFADENARVKHDPDHSREEDRFILLGFSARLRLLIVCHAYREHDEVIRIISARRATPNERKQYGSYL
ncbi:MAG: BrnT family toxin [bacterium]|nr:BrnT family toxin [bacterium]